MIEINLARFFLKIKLMRHSFSSQIFSNLAIGLVIAILVTALQGVGVRWVVGLENGAIDWIMSMHRGSVASNISTPLAYIDIDEKTYEHWNEPFYSPRSALQTTLETINSSKTKGIILDIDLSRKGFDENDDQKLISYLKNYDIKNAPLILVKSFSSSSIDNDILLNQKKSSISGLEEIVKNKPNITWASTLFPVDVDGVVRRWRLWELTCKQESIQIIPSVQLLIAGIQNDITFNKLNQQLQEAIVNTEKLTCDKFIIEDYSKLKPIKLGSLNIQKSNNSLVQRIVYSIPWKNRINESSMMINNNGVQTQLFISRSIYPFIKKLDIDVSWLKDRIVIIGSSYSESRDIHMTPIGYMPGSMVLINSINSLIGYGLVERPNLFIRIMILILLIALVTIIFSTFSSFIGFIISSIVILISFVPFSYFLFSNGIWLDFALPIFAVQLHELILTFKDEFRRNE